MDVSEKYVEKRLLKILTEDEVLMGYKDTDQYKTFNFVDLCSGVGIVCMVDHNPNTSQWHHCCHFFR